MRGTLALIGRDLKRFVRQPSRIIASIGTPASIWLVLGSGFAGSFASPAGQESYAAYLVPGMATMIVLFASIFAAISLIEDRASGFLQSVLVSPLSARSAVAARTASCAVLSLAQGLVILMAAPLAGLRLTPLSLATSIAALALISIAVSGVGLAFAWRVRSTQGFHGVMNLVLMPMLLLSGAFFPIETSARWLETLMRLNPLSWGATALRQALNQRACDPLLWLGAAGFAAAAFSAAVLVVGDGRERA